MKRMMFLYAVCMVVNMSRGQRTCVVADMFTHIPIGNVRVIADHYESKAVRTNYKGEFDITSSFLAPVLFIIRTSRPLSPRCPQCFYAYRLPLQMW